VGSGSQEHKAFLQKHFPGIKRRNRSSFLASEVARLAETRLKTRTGQTDPQKLEPFYIRKPDAETKQQPPPSVNQGRQGG
jgi:hypothetical protein